MGHIGSRESRKICIHLNIFTAEDVYKRQFLHLLTVAFESRVLSTKAMLSQKIEERKLFLKKMRNFLIFLFTVKKNVPWHILAPRRGCFSNHLPLRRVRILAERFSFIGRIFL